MDACELEDPSRRSGWADDEERPFLAPEQRASAYEHVHSAGVQECHGAEIDDERAPRLADRSVERRGQLGGCVEIQLTQRLSRAGISSIMTSEIPDLFHVGRLAEYGISHLSDNVVLLQYLRADSRLLRTVTILKSRASAHDPEIREFDITPDGIVLGDPVTGEHV
jgi:hypothetical protein